MDKYGIKSLESKYLDFDYDKYYKELSLKLKNSENINNLRIQERINLSDSINIQIDIKKLKENFIYLLNDNNSSKYLWILYSKYNNNENYIDKISNILKKENEVIRSGINIYKTNGWMTHTLYVYQIVNFNIANNFPICNFNGNKETIKEVEELHKIYNTLTPEGKFILKVFALIHDIGVTDNVQFHDKAGSKFVNEVLNDIGITDNFLSNLNISYNNFQKILEELIKNHTLMALFSGEKSDKNMEETYKNMMSAIPNINVKNEISKILFLLTFADVIAVTEDLMDTFKYEKLKKCYMFFEEIINKKTHIRNKEQVALQRICDISGVNHVDIDTILEEYNINKESFIEDMYNIKWFKYTSPLMKTLKNIKLTVKVFYELFELIKCFEGEEALKEYTITFVPSKSTVEYEFIKEFENNNFFKCIKQIKENGNNIYGNTCIESGEDEVRKVFIYKSKLKAKR